MMVLIAMALALGAPTEKSQTSCRTLHGRMMATNGQPALRIWEIGTRHYLGVDVGQNLSLDALPANIRRTWITATAKGSLFDASLYGDFRVCRRKPRREGEMELVRVTNGQNLVVGPYK